MQHKMDKKIEKPVHKEEKAFSEGRGIIRIMGTDIPANSTVYCGLTKIKGVSWGVSNAVCHNLEIDRKKKMNELGEKDLEKIGNFLKEPKLLGFLVNRRRDADTGEDKHLIKTELDLRREFDIRNMKKIRTYKGWRHAMGQPVRGQRTKSHFRKGRSIGVQRSKAKPAKGGK